MSVGVGDDVDVDRVCSFSLDSVMRSFDLLLMRKSSTEHVYSLRSSSITGGSAISNVSSSLYKKSKSSEFDFILRILLILIICDFPAFQ